MSIFGESRNYVPKSIVESRYSDTSSEKEEEVKQLIPEKVVKFESEKKPEKSERVGDKSNE